MKMDELKEMLRAWEAHRGITEAYDICEFLLKNLDLGGKK